MASYGAQAESTRRRSGGGGGGGGGGGYSGYTPQYGFVKPPPVSTMPLPTTPVPRNITPAMPSTGGGGLGIAPLGGGNKDGGGGGGGGTGTQPLPPGSLTDPQYAGPTGGVTANKDPQAQQDYIRWALMQAGIIGNTDTPYSRWAEDTLLDDIYKEFVKSQGTNKALDVRDFIMNTYGAGYTGSGAVTGGKHGNKIKTPSSWVYGQGDFGQTTGGLPERYQDFLSEDDPAGFLAGIVGGTSDPEWTQFFNTFQLQIQSELAAARRASGNMDLTLNQFVKGRDLAGEANAAFSDFLSTQHPEDTIRGLLGGAGGDMTDPDYASWFNNVMLPSIEAGFQAARRANPKLSLSQYLAANPGAVSGGAGAFAEYKANLHPEDYITGQAVNQGTIMPVGGNQDFQTWYKQQAIPNQLSQLSAARQGNPTLGVKSFFDPQSLGAQARLQYLYRPSATRLPSQTVQAGRYSWWG